MSRCALLLVTILVTATPALSQNLGIGGQVGDPTGVTLRFGNTLDLAAGWNLRTDAFFVQGHVLLGTVPLGTRRRGAAAPLHFFYGPGLFVGVNSRQGRDDDVAFGASFNAGLSYFAGPIELFGQLTPRLQLVDATDFKLGGAIGLRFYP